MFYALIAGLFFVLFVWAYRQNQKALAEIRRLEKERADQQGELQKAEQRVQRVLGCLESLFAPRSGPKPRVSWPDLAELTVQSAGPLLGMDIVVLLRWDPERAEYKSAAGRGLSPQQLNALRVRKGEGILGRAAQSGQPLIVQEARPAPAGMDSFLAAPYWIFPLQVKTSTEGLLVLCRPQNGVAAPDALRLAGLLAGFTAIALENAHLSGASEQVYAEWIRALSHAAGVQDANGQGHSDHCHDWVREMAQEMHLPRALAEQIEFGAMLHDIGKLGVPESILSKGEALNVEEYAIVKRHPAIGYQMLRHVDFLRAVAPIVLYHHEWVNGDGYPEGLAGEEIPLGARMVAIADAWDSMTTSQPYRKALSRSAAIAELRHQAGAQFDPKLVDVFLHVVERKPAAFKPVPSPLAGEG